MIRRYQIWEQKASEGHYAIPHFKRMERRNVNGSY